MADQAMLVSGESGAGKTVTTKHIMKYLASLSERKAEHDKRRRAPSPGRDEEKIPRRSQQVSRRMSRAQSWKTGAQIEEKILKSNPILESFGNARTIRNDNSSRFGKFIELQFRQNGSLIGAVIDTYLLEKIRLVHQSPGERNFHIFYEMLSAANEDEREDYFLQDFTVEDFKLTNQSGTTDRRDGVQDTVMFDKLVLSMGTMGIEPKTQEDIFRCTMAFLHASNLTFEAVDDDSSKLDESNPHLEPVLALLGLEKEDFESALCQFEIEAGSTSYTRTVSKDSALKGLEALIKSTYGCMFSFIVQSINKKIDYKMGKGMRGVSKAAFIGVLDIFGFESFDVNSFEQMCINYCNEALQQQFNLYIFKNEQEEYKREGIAWKNIEFPDNQEVIELIDKRAEGIIPLLTDQCKTARGSDKSFAESLYKRCEKHPRFHAPALIKGKKQFIINHYAGPVVYHYEGFVEKNRDEIPRGASTLLEGSSIAFVQLLGQIGSVPANSSTGRASKRPTAGGQFTRQLTELRKRIDLTSPHYIRCLKPNQSLQPDEFDKAMIADQLRYAGVLEAIRVSRVGYSQRYTHDTFVSRYRFIALDELAKASDKLSILIKIIATKIFESENPNAAMPSDLNDAVGIQKGMTKVFLRQPAFDYMEAFRTEKLGGSAVSIQAVARMYLARCAFLRDKDRIIIAQACVRRHMARRFIIQIRNDKAATALQGHYRMWCLRKQFLEKKWLATWFQKMTRGNAGRQRFQELYEVRRKEIELSNRKYNAAVSLQCLYRGNVGRADVAAIKKREATNNSFYGEQSEAVTMLRQQNKTAALQADKAAAIAYQTRKERKKEVEALRHELEGASAAADKAKLTQEEILNVQSEVEMLRKELEVSKAETERARTRLAVVESENKMLKDKVDSGSFIDGYKSTRFDEHADLVSLDERIHNIALRSKQGKKDLEALVQSLAILK